ncbi:MAG: CDP-alcohol phosphatidyltransferase family protein [Oscillospiraceae bacterium]|jgi:cardiolipin synthase|nr:CDP-alcohol phosphatidyltransferase family protein [Oscillospiraceae bacterium]MCI1991124.1 CDP-alcohol phosphatidyltransferase family protein [Oscillospiraceae bacterium]MCI2036027.1 CDP-alcohol phosphatidyltransferase family protein [Oscillospiraceae bacterium]
MRKRVKNKNFNVPNTLTVLRFFLIIPFVYYFLGDHYVKAVVILAISGLTDMLDGLIARKFNQFTELGQMLDPLFDKLTQAAVAICLAVKQPILIPLLAIFVVKECLMVTAAIILISRNKKKPSGSKWYGKVATVMFYISFGIIVALQSLFGKDYLAVSITLLSITAGFMIYAFVRYAKSYFKILHSDDPQYNLDIQEIMDKKKNR